MIDVARICRLSAVFEGARTICEPRVGVGSSSRMKNGLRERTIASVTLRYASSLPRGQRGPQKLFLPELLDITGQSAIAGRPRAVRVTSVGILLQVLLHRPPLALHELLDGPLGHIVILRRLQRLETAQVALAGVLERRDRQLGQVALVPQRQAAAPAVGRLGSACRGSAGARGASGDGPLEPLASTRVLSDVGALDMSRPSLALPSAVGPPDAGFVSPMTSTS